MERPIAALIALALGAPLASAQEPATSIGDLRSRLSIGETVFVTNQAGETIKGKVQQVSDTGLVLRRGPSDLVVNALDVQRVARRGHSVRNGALIGLAAGFVAGGAWAASQPCTFTCFSSPGGMFIVGGLFGSIGMGGGAAVGASLRREQVLFERHAMTLGAQTAIIPLLSQRDVGLLVGRV